MSGALERRAARAAEAQAARIAARLADVMPDARIARDGTQVRVVAAGAIARAGWIRGMIA